MADSFPGTSAQVTPFNFGTHAVRVIKRDGVPWFVAADVCAALGYVNPSKAVADHLDDDERSNESLDQTGRGSKAIVINESGLYALVLRSRKPEARKFAKWVTSEVLPSIRKTGSYTAPPAASALPAPTSAALPEHLRLMVVMERGAVISTRSLTDTEFIVDARSKSSLYSLLAEHMPMTMVPVALGILTQRVAEAVTGAPPAGWPKP